MDGLPLLRADQWAHPLYFSTEHIVMWADQPTKQLFFCGTQTESTPTFTSCPCWPAISWWVEIETLTYPDDNQPGTRIKFEANKPKLIRKQWFLIGILPVFREKHFLEARGRSVLCEFRNSVRSRRVSKSGSCN